MKLIKTTFVGIGQIFLQENGLSGLLITIAMFFSHWTLGVSCFLGALIGTLTAKSVGFPQEQINQGLYGFNGSLAFMCVLFTFGLEDPAIPLVWGLGVVAAITATLIMHAFIKAGKVAYTFPFVVTCWIFCWAVAKFHLFGLSQTTPRLMDYTDTIHSIGEAFYAWAEINFGSSLMTGILLFIAIAVSSPMAAMWGMAVAPISALLAYQCFNVDLNTLANGIYSFSAILVACAFAGPKFSNFCYVIGGVILAVVVHYAVAQTGLAAYTIGFIVASWIILLIKNIVEKSGIENKRFNQIMNP
ncbi:urea transporter [Bisgaard Taxon 10/6]|uniref:urea transporter n=1 Tax=Exercitatus varius TaxID=67857 RepID=UPI00294AB909|nr:urea transporter [Exercitatus varius]MDG2960741.1 urea transporter [Exercitatus varius]